jgi:hypothetical protein
MKIKDISQYDTSTDFLQHDGFIIRAIRTNGLLDTSLDTHINGAKTANKPYGFYFYINFKRNLQAQINVINNFLASHPCALRPAIDIERDSYDNSVVPSNIGNIVNACQSGVPNSMIYCNPDMIKNYLGSNFKINYLWLAQYGVSQPTFFANCNHLGWQHRENPDENEFKEDVLMNTLPTALFIDAAGVATIKVSGWATAPTGINRIDIYLNNEVSPRASAHTGMPRQDVADNLKNPDAINSGFDCDVPLTDLFKGIQQIRIAAIANDSTVEWKIIKFN